MGAAVSCSGAKAVPSYSNKDIHRQSVLDQRIRDALRELKAQENADTKHKMNFERILMKFGIARDAFAALHTIYESFASGSEIRKGLDLTGLKEALVAMGVQMDDSDVYDIFNVSDVVPDSILTEQEFVVALSVSYLLGLLKNLNVTTSLVSLTAPDTGAWSHDYPSQRSTFITVEKQDDPSNPGSVILNGLRLMVVAYQSFDRDGSGTIQVSEVRSMMVNGNERTKKLQSEKKTKILHISLPDERIKEMDLNCDGTINFQEFIITFQNWVGSNEN